MASGSTNSLEKSWGQPAEVSQLVAAPLFQDFYQRYTLDVSRDLLGKLLLVRSKPQYDWNDPRAQVTGGRIVETEAYRADDPASHSYRGETERCKVMFGEPGFAYVYFIYGMYEMLNFVTEPKGAAGAVLIRALEPIWGLEIMKKRRKTDKVKDLCSGPGKLCRALGILMSHYGESLAGPRICVASDSYLPQTIAVSPRVGIQLAKDQLWRFYMAGSPFVSRVPQNSLSKLIHSGDSSVHRLVEK